MQSSKFLVHGAVLHFSTNSKKIYREIHKDFGRFETDETLKADAKVKIIETEGKFPIEIPEYAIRDSIVFPTSAMYIFSNQIFLGDENKYIIQITPIKNEIIAYTKPTTSISEKMRHLIKQMLIKILENKNVFFIHGSGVMNNNVSLFFIGSSGAGKTTTLITLLQEGFKMITDDTIFLSNGEVLPFHIRSMIHEDMLHRFPVLKQGLNENSTYVSEAKGWWMDLEDVFPVHKERIRPSKLFYVYVWNSAKSKCEEIPEKEMLSKLSQTYLQEVSSIFSTDTSKMMKKVFPVYHSLLEDVDCYKVFVGRNTSEFLKVVTSIIDEVI